MANITIENVNLGSVIVEAGDFADELLTLAAAAVLPEGTILSRDTVTQKLVPYVVGGQALKRSADGPFNLDPGDTLVINTNGGGNETVTFDATQATITDTTTYPVADQDGKSFTVTITGGEYDGVVQTITFAGATTTAASVAAQFNDQVQGASVAVVGGQVEVETDGAGTDFDIAVAVGTSNLTWAASVAGTGDAGDINAVTATEVKTVVEADTTDLTVTVDGLAAVFTATTSIQFVSGNALTPLGLTAETVSSQGNGIPGFVMTYEVDAGVGDTPIRPMKTGRVRLQKLSTVAGDTITKVVEDLLRHVGLVCVSVVDYSILDNQ